jgi:hypothetical protein
VEPLRKSSKNHASWSCNRCAFTALSLRNLFEIASKTIWDSFAIAAESMRNRRTIAAQSLWNRCAIAAQSLRNRRVIAA